MFSRKCLVVGLLLLALVALSVDAGKVRNASAGKKRPAIVIKAWVSRPRAPKLRNSKAGWVNVHFKNTFSKSVAVAATGTPLDLSHKRWPQGDHFKVSFYDVNNLENKVEAIFNGVSSAPGVMGKRNFVVLPAGKVVRVRTKLAEAYSNRSKFDKKVKPMNLRFKASLRPITFRDFRVCDNAKANSVKNCVSAKKVAYFRNARNGKGYELAPLNAVLPKRCKIGRSVSGVLFPRNRKTKRGGKGKGKGKGKGHSAVAISLEDVVNHAKSEGHSAGVNPKITFYGCNGNQQRDIRKAVTTVINHMPKCASDAGRYDSKYRRWFGTSLEGYIARNMFNSVNSHLRTKQLRIVCKGGNGICRGANAYVYPSDRWNRVYLCNHWWSRSQTAWSKDHNSRPSIILHEYSHFNNIGGTRDHAYGIPQCENLARSNSWRARRNADSYGYYYDVNFIKKPQPPKRTCFPPRSLVSDAQGNYRSLEQLSRGDKVLAYDLSQKKVVEDEVIGFFHRDLTPSSRLTYLNFHLEDGSRFTVSPTHLIFRSDSQAVFAEKISKGDSLLYKGTPMKVESISEEAISGLVSPITHSGTIIVDGVVSSCYAELNSHRIAHVSLFPIRLASKLSQWIRVPSSVFESEGGEVLGYARALTWWTNTFVPSLFA